MRSIEQLSSLANRKALVTGAAGHIGLAICEALVELGAQVAVVDKDPAACEERARVLSGARHGSAFSVPCDLVDEKATRDAVLASVERMKGLDILVHSAAYVNTNDLPGWAVPLEQQTVAAWDVAVRVNLTSAFVLVQAAREALAASGKGSVIFLGSIYGVVGPDHRLYEGTAMANPAGYGATKGGLLQLMRYFATTLAPLTRVNAITPGGVWRDHPDAFHERYKSRTPMGRMAVEEDFKGAVAYLSSDLSSYVTGQNLIVDGGWTAW